DTIDHNYNNEIEVTQSKTNQTVNLIEVKVKIIIDTKKTSSMGKWFIFKEEEINNFYSFQSSLNNHIRKCLDLRYIDYDDYEVTYKINGRGQAMCINEKDDFLNFIEECKEPDNLAKRMYIYTNASNDENNKKKKLKPNYTPKESDLNEDEYNQAQVIMELRNKYKCSQHVTPCYVEDEHHLQLNAARLTLWAHDIVLL
ncbi:6675_t:CDS:2, partial [Dentiscutata heterogama]